MEHRERIMDTAPVTLLELNNRIARLIQTDETRNIWVTAELSDVAVRRGHCYMELLQKDDAGVQLAKARGVIWANFYPYISQKFLAATGQAFTTGIKLMICVSATMHPVFGLSLVISDVDPNYTLGDAIRRRKEILKRLEAEGVINDNRKLPWPIAPQRIAIISAPGAAGYGDFINQLYNNPSRLRFTTKLFPSAMQGEHTASSVIRALDLIAAEEDLWDCVVIIRGGGATSDLLGFEDYNLAANICNFPLPVIVGIGHERDTTVLDFVANMRVKTPTAAAEWLISQGNDFLGKLQSISQDILHTVRERIAGQKEQLSYYQGLLPIVPFNAIRNASDRLSRAVMTMSALSSLRIAPATARLEVLHSKLSTSAANLLSRNLDRLDAASKLVDALSPQAVLNRGFSITRFNGHVITDPASVPEDAIIETLLARGSFKSVKSKS